MAKIDKDGELNQTATSRSSDKLPNIIVVQLESYFDVANAEFSPHLKMHARICTIYIRIIQTDILKYRL